MNTVQASPSTVETSSAFFRPSAGETWVQIALVGLGLAGAAGVIVAFGGRGHLHTPNLSLLIDQPWTLKLHITAAVTAFLLGCVMLVRVKGDALHRAMGWTWVACMVTVAVSSFFFPWVLKGHLSPIHLLSGWVAISVPMGVAFARRHNIQGHRRMMTYNFLLGLVVAGAFTLVPGRLMWRVFFG